MKIIIVGAGIAGLAAGIALRRAGHDVLIIEKSLMAHEAGAAIYIQPNASHILARWGFCPTRARANIGRYTNLGWADSLQSIERVDHGPSGNGAGGCQDLYGGENYYLHRADLHTELKILADEHKVDIKKGLKVVEIDSSNGLIICADKSTHHADLIIGADGVHSIAIHSVLGHAAKRKSGTAYDCFRILIPTDEFEEFWEIDNDYDEKEYGESKIWDRKVAKNSFWSLIDPKSGNRFVWFPIRNNTLQYIGVVSRTLTPDNQNDSPTYNDDANIRTILACAENFHPILKKMICKATEVKGYKISAREPLPYWHRNRVLLIGDSAHAMLPFQGQGAAQAIQDAAALEVLFANFNPDKGNKVETDQEIEKRMQLFEKVRFRHATATQLLSDNPSMGRRELNSLLAEWIDGEIPLTYSDQCKWKFEHDTTALAQKVLTSS